MIAATLHGKGTVGRSSALGTPRRDVPHRRRLLADDGSPPASQQPFSAHFVPPHLTRSGSIADASPHGVDLAVYADLALAAFFAATQHAAHLEPTDKCCSRALDVSLRLDQPAARMRQLMARARVLVLNFCIVSCVISLRRTALLL